MKGLFVQMYVLDRTVIFRYITEIQTIGYRDMKKYDVEMYNLDGINVC
ncbi:hypothetical protein [Carboxylicivirga sp. RSCT41]